MCCSARRNCAKVTPKRRDPSVCSRQILNRPFRALQTGGPILVSPEFAHGRSLLPCFAFLRNSNPPWLTNKHALPAARDVIPKADSFWTFLAEVACGSRVVSGSASALRRTTPRLRGVTQKIAAEGRWSFPCRARGAPAPQEEAAKIAILKSITLETLVSDAADPAVGDGAVREHPVVEFAEWPAGFEDKLLMEFFHFEAAEKIAHRNRRA